LIRVDVVFDTICPWCYIGKRRLERALALRPHVRASLHWHPFLLNPDMPPSGISREVYLERKFGSPHRIQRILDNLAVTGQGDEICFQFDRIERTPSTIHSHRLIRFAARYGMQSDLVERIFQAYFAQYRDIGQIAELVQIGVEAGLPERELRLFLDSDEEMLTVLHENARAHRLGVSGVPSFLFEEGFAIAGAQEPDVIARLIDLSWETCSARQKLSHGDLNLSNQDLASQPDLASPNLADSDFVA